MNRDNVIQLRDRMNSLHATGQNERFNWNYWSGWRQGEGNAINPDRPTPLPRDVAHDCGTTACVAGWAVALFDQEINAFLRHGGNWIKVGGELLGISEDDAHRLFGPAFAISYAGLHRSWDGHTNDVPPRAVALVLDHLLETGRVDWSVIGPRQCFNENGEEITG